MVETKTNLKIKCLISYNGGEFTLNEFMEIFGKHGIKRKFSATGHLTNTESLKERT
jgi:transposase InsO family protein